MSKRLQDLDEQLVLNNDAYMLVKQNTVNGDRDFRIPVNTLLQNTLQTSNIGTNVGDLVTLIAGASNPALPAVSGEFLTGIEVPEASASTSGTVQLSASLSFNAGVADGWAATPSAVRELQNSKAALQGAAFTGDISAPNIQINSGGKLRLQFSSGLEDIIEGSGGILEVGSEDKTLQLRGNSLFFEDWNTGSPILRPVFHTGNAGTLNNGIRAEFLGSNSASDYSLKAAGEVITGQWNFTDDLLLDLDVIVKQTGSYKGIRADNLTELTIASINGTDDILIGEDTGTHGDLILQTDAAKNLLYKKGLNTHEVFHSGDPINPTRIDFLSAHGASNIGVPASGGERGSISVSGSYGTDQIQAGYSVNNRAGLYMNQQWFDWSLYDYVLDKAMLTAAPSGALSIYYDNAIKLSTLNEGVNITGELQLGSNPILRDDSGNWLLIDPDSSFTTGARYDGNLFRLDSTFHIGNAGTTLLVDGSNFKYNSNNVFHAGNMGSGSGLDADTLDTLESSQLMRSDADTSTTGSLSGDRIFSGYDSTLAGSISCSNWFRTQGDTGLKFDTYGGGIYMIDTQYVRVSDSKKFYVNSVANDSIRTDGGVLAAGNVTAFSDKNVKTDLQVIPDALEKVCELTGYTYERTDGEFERQTGVIAQEVLEVLPEAVESYQLDGEERLGVAYGNMIGLLIESIKDLKAEIDELKQGL